MNKATHTVTVHWRKTGVSEQGLLVSSTPFSVEILLEGEDEPFRFIGIGSARWMDADHHRRVSINWHGKRCGCCGRVYRHEEWAEIPSKGIENYGGDMVLDYRDCSCGNTLAMPVLKGKADDSPSV